MLNAGFVCFFAKANWVSCSLYNLELIRQTGQTNIPFVRLIALLCLFGWLLGWLVGRFFVYLVGWLGLCLFICFVCTTEDENYSFHMVLYH